MSRDLPALHSLLHAFRRFAGVSSTTGSTHDARDELSAATLEHSSDDPADARPSAHAAAVTTPISVVIAGCRGPQAVACCLAAVLAQRFDATSFEVIVVDDAASDEVREVVAALTPVGGAPAVRYRRVASGGAVAARNQGWREAAGVVVAFTDDRRLPDPDWLAGGERAMRAGHLALGSSVCVPASRRRAAGRALQRLQSGSAFVRREVLERVGGFDERCAMV
jgi:GT2 family glycosyltransferase